MITRRSFETTANRRHTMTGQRLQRDGFIWEVRRTLDESYTWCRREDHERNPINSVCPSIPWP